MQSVISIGTFDGVHRGHRALLSRARDIAAAHPGTQVVAMAFEPHPLTILSPGSAPARLTTFAQRRELLLKAGADRVERLEPTSALLSLAPEEFVRRLISKHHPVAVVEGPDFRFGYDRAGNIETLRQLGTELGFTCEIVERITAVLADHAIVPATSTMVRWLISQGRVRDAAAILGRPYSLAGTVVHGDRRGRLIAFPTANLLTDCLVPADGVYAGVAFLADGRRFAAGVHVGGRATFGDPRRTIEAHLLGVPLEIDRSRAGGETRRIAGLLEYGWTMELSLIAWLRDQMKFESVDQLVEQMGRDCRRAASIVTADDPTHALQGAAA